MGSTSKQLLEQWVPVFIKRSLSLSLLSVTKNYIKIKEEATKFKKHPQQQKPWHKRIILRKRRAVTKYKQQNLKFSLNSGNVEII